MTRMEDALRAELIDQAEIVRFAPPSVRAIPLPDYVQHRDDIDAVGKAASEAMALQYHGAIKALEAMGAELIDCAKKAEAMAAQSRDALAYIIETCDFYRAESKLLFARIEHASALSAEVREVCAELRNKIHDQKPERVDPRDHHSGQDEASADQQGGVSDALVRGVG